ncbi:delta-sarcoglycan-like [Uloborus diversus]|uniref:delta-sarcoglycan-like n=1 Tax=Uloborus diversus TaxID=327109 RepID=UPI00240A4A93|nr:delta-sarcoglycan-like [Uloborus diversus]
MSSGHTVAIPASPLPEWTDSDHCPVKNIDPYFSNCLFRIGIYGWRKRCLYFLLILLCSMIVINLSLTVWIIKVLDFTMDGMGNLKIKKEGIRLEGQSVFLKTLQAAKIRSRQNQLLRFESFRNITINARNSKGQIVGKLNMGEGKLEVFTKQFLVRKANGEIVLRVDNTGTNMSARKMRVTGKDGITFTGSIQTPVVKSESTDQLRLESPTRRLKVQAPQGISLESRTGDISATCLKNLELHSKQGVIQLDSKHILFKDLQTVLPTNRGRSYQGIYEMCSCQNGRLFLSSPEDHCRADDEVCR